LGTLVTGGRIILKLITARWAVRSWAGCSSLKIWYCGVPL
jgi:hypothetical protein